MYLKLHHSFVKETQNESPKKAVIKWAKLDVISDKIVVNSESTLICERNVPTAGNSVYLMCYFIKVLLV